MKTRMALVLAVSWVTGFAYAGAYPYYDFKTKNMSTFLGLEYSTAICETREGLDAAKGGAQGWYWVQISVPEFCRLAHQHRSNDCDYRKVRSWDGFWETTENCHERDRMVSWCNVHRNLHDKYYRCRNVNDDLKAEQDRVMQEKAKILEEWKAAVREKKRALLLENEPVRKQLELQLARNQSLVAARKSERSRLETELQQANQNAEAFITFHQAALAELNTGFEKFDALSALLQKAMEDDATAMQSLGAAFQTDITLTLSPQVTAADLDSLEAKLQTTRATNTICGRTRSSEGLSQLRLQLARLGGMVTAYDAQLKQVTGLPSLAEFKGRLLDNLSALSAAVALRGQLFTDDTRALDQRPELCGSFEALTALHGARRAQVGVNGTTSALGSLAADFDTSVEGTYVKVIADHQRREAERFLAGIQARFSDHLTSGRATEALFVVQGAKTAATLMLDNLKEMGFDATLLADLKAKADALIANLDSQREASLDITGIRARIAKRMQKLAVRMAQVSAMAGETPTGKLRSETEIYPRMAEVLVPGISNAVPPQFATEAEALDFDARVATAEVTLESFVEELKNSNEVSP